MTIGNLGYAHSNRLRRGVPNLLFNFIGCPQSGKTTTAAMVFAGLKEVGFVAEFIPEQARFYIAKHKLSYGIQPHDKVKLSDVDQLNIMKTQVEADETFVFACGPSVMVVSDSSPLNSMLYMTPEFRKDPRVQELLKRSLAITTLSFYSQPIPRPYSDGDPNRIHSYDQSLEIHRQIPDLLKEMAQDLHLVDVYGTTMDRLQMCQESILTQSS